MDACKAIAAIAVIAIHTSSYTLSGIKDKASELYYIVLIVNQISRFSVPVFVFLSGLGLALSYKKDTNYFKFEFKRLLNVVPEYLIWCFIYLYIIKNNRNLDGWIPLILKGDGVYYHLYFVPMIVKLYIFFPILYIVMRNKLGVLVSFIITAGILNSAHYFNIPDLRLDFYSKRNIVFWIFYFSLGIYASSRLYTYIGKVKKKKLSIIIFHIICTALLIMESVQGMWSGKPIDYYTTFIRPTVIIYSLSTIIFLFSLNYKKSFLLSFLRLISDKSYIIYLAHPFILNYYMEYLKDKKIPLGSSWFLISSTAICILVTLLMGIVVSKVKFLVINRHWVTD